MTTLQHLQRQVAWLDWIAMGKSRMQRRMGALYCGFALLFLAHSFAAEQKDARIEEVMFHSAALNGPATFSVVLPTQQPPAGGYPVLLILHGLGRNHHTLLDNAETLDLLKAQPYVIVLPDSARGWWIDSPVSGTNYDGMLLDVIAEVEKRYPVSQSPSLWGVMGWSMGGFGTLHFAEHHPERISFVGSVIGLLDFPRVEGLPEGQRFPVDRSVFGAEADEWSKENPSQHVTQLAGKKLVVVVGMQAFDRTMNENFLNRAQANGLHPEVYRIEGAHVFPTVASGLRILLPLATVHFSQAKPPAISAPNNGAKEKQ